MIEIKDFIDEKTQTFDSNGCLNALVELIKTPVITDVPTLYTYAYAVMILQLARAATENPWLLDKAYWLALSGYSDIVEEYLKIIK